MVFWVIFKEIVFLKYIRKYLQREWYSFGDLIQGKPGSGQLVGVWRMITTEASDGHVEIQSEALNQNYLSALAYIWHSPKSRLKNQHDEIIELSLDYELKLTHHLNG